MLFQHVITCRLAGLVLALTINWPTCTVLSEAKATTTAERNETKTNSSDNHFCRSNTTAKTDNPQVLLEWLLGHEDAYWNPKQKFRSVRDGGLGVFASGFLPEDTLLAQIPWTAVIRAPSTFQRFKNCDAVQVLKDEMGKGNSSVYWPYTETLVGNARDHCHLLPAHWSPEGQEMLSGVLGSLSPKDIFLKDFSWKDKCQQISTEATLLAMTHAEHFGVAPIANQYNHRRAPHTGAYFSSQGKSGLIALEVRAHRDLAAGEQIYTDYHNYAPKDEPALRGQIGTLELFRDYGFVESYPQVYIFHDQQIAFEIFQWKQQGEEQEDDGPTSDESLETLEIDWLVEIHNKEYLDLPALSDEYSGTDKEDMEAATDFLRKEYQRLNNDSCPKVFKLNETTSKLNAQETAAHEIGVINRLCDALLVALKLALDDLGEIQFSETLGCLDGYCEAEQLQGLSNSDGA